MASSRHRHRHASKRGTRRWPLLGFGAGGAVIAAAAIALTLGLSQAGSGQACAAVLPAAMQAAQAPQAGLVSGTATHYVLQGLPNCSYPSPPADGLFVAMPPDEFAGAAGCGGYLEVHGPDGSVRVEVIDQCPDCAAGHIDLSETAFSAIAPLSAGLVSVTYQHLASPPLPAPLSLRVKEGSSQYWLALLAMNTGNPLASVQVEDGSGGWHDLSRASYNYWIASSGAGTGPFTVRLTDTAGHVATVHDIALSPGTIQDTGTRMYGAGTTTAPAPEPTTPPATTPPASSAGRSAPPRPAAAPATPSRVPASPAASPQASPRQLSSPASRTSCATMRT